MKDLNPSLQNHLASGVATLAFCWILRRGDGVALGFTDHDMPIELNGVTCEPASGFNGTEIRQSASFASDDQEVTGVLSSDRITETDLISGRYDGARIETWRVNWTDATQTVLLREGYLGEIKRDRQSFQVEIRSLSVALEQERGRVYQYTCDATLGDARCGVDLSAASHGFTGTIAAMSSPTLVSVDVSGMPNMSFARGSLHIKSGDAEGMSFDVLGHSAEGNADNLELWLPIHSGAKVGDMVRVTVGCDKTFRTCRECFANQNNFRGFPHMPGNDFIISYPEQRSSSNGESLGLL
ncbi:phage conserved hypothetical protein BR0599 [Cohaesibacter sp. ES.047]|uniref:DUF2163 domain-containing protein n=1 Tax=Cohaesibacter sp. ES.047 TaxID=1798205 RepID=UPI000BB8F2EC|nr:DUF2163 domain-containing protein [Cohaesibacter sp. ES.047]SNY92806.1 phage conserved hypothetical protein BR0599 [Cohaesibacter sp. ES.047]